MKTITFKTNINCSGCVEKATPFLDEAAGAGNWKVDTQNPAKLLTIEKEGVHEKDIVSTLQKAGFKADVVK
jgi:copper chaperone CopZ